jgi:hypothetical protein
MLRTPSILTPSTYKTQGDSLIITSSPVEDVGLCLRRIEYNSASYANVRYLQGFSGKAVPANGAFQTPYTAGAVRIPLFQPITIPSGGSGSVEFANGGLYVPPPGLVLVVSSSQTQLTKDASATVDLFADVDEWESSARSQADSFAGDLSTAVKTLQVWAEASGPKRLKRLQIKNLVASARYAVVYGVDSPAASSRIATWFPVGASANVDIHLGWTGGLSPLQVQTDGTQKQGCTVHCATTLTPGNQSSGDDFNIRATYA